MSSPESNRKRRRVLAQPDAHVRLYVATFTFKQRAPWNCLRCGAVIRHMDRPRDRTGRLFKTHCGCASPSWLNMTPEQLREHKRQVMIGLKRKCRRQKGARLRADMSVKAHARREAAAIRKSQRDAMAALHDAHVKRYAYVVSCRFKYANRYNDDPQAERERSAKRKQALPDSYVIQNLKSMGIPAESVTPVLIALKREAMQYRRMSHTIKTTVKNHLKEDHEAIPKHP